MRKLLVVFPLLAACGGASAQSLGTPVAAAVPAQDPVERTITVGGAGTVELEPDRAIVAIAVETQGRTAQEAAAANAQRMDAVIAAIRRAGIPQAQIRTTGYMLHPDYRHEREREPVIVGYRATNRVLVTIDDIARVGNVIDQSIGAGANRVEGVNFGLRDPEAARQEALRLAVQNARAAAQTLATAAGAALGDALQISAGAAHAPPPPLPMMRGMVALEAAAVETPVTPGQVSFTATVTIVYRMLPR
jgi:uncharacterized protein